MAMGVNEFGKRNNSDRTTFVTSHSAILAMMVMVFGLLFLSIVAIGTTNVTGNDPFVYLTFFVNLILGLTCFVMSVTRRPFSIIQVHWVFYITFFVIAPLSQYTHGYAPWGYMLTDADYQTSNMLLTGWGVLFAVASMGLRGRKRRSFKGFYDDFYAGLPQISGKAEIVLVSLSVVATMLVVSYVGFGNLFARSTFSTGLDQTSSLLLDKGIRAIPVFAFVLVLVRCIQLRKVDVLTVIAGILIIISCFPAGMARYNAATIYGGLALLAFKPMMERKGIFPLILLFGLLIVFPASNVYRFSSFGVETFINQVGATVSNLPLGFCSGDYDAYSMFARSVHYVAQNGTAAGFQLATVALFFIPRSIWTAKGVGSGAMIASSQGQSFVNVSCPLPGEGMINFGIAGMVLFAIVAGLLCWKFDSWFYEGSGGGRLFYVFACMLFFFMLRGDLLSSWAYTVGYLTCFAALLFISTRFLDRFQPKG